MSDLSQETRDLLDRGRAGEPIPEARRDRLKSAILAQAAVASIATTTTTAAAWTTMAAKAAIVVSAIAVAGTGIGVISARIDHASEVRAQSAAAKRAAAVAVEPIAQPVTRVTPVQTSEPSSISAPVAESAPSDVAPARRTPLAKPTPATPVPALAIDKSAPAPLPAPVAASPANASIDPAVAPSSSLASPLPSSLAEESRLLRDAHRALGDGDSTAALALLDQHGSRFPASVLEPERSAERVLALCQAGRIDDAHAAAASFLSAHPSGPLATRVRASCAGR